MSEIHPELASKYDKQNVRDWWMSEKLDGVRAWWIDGKIYSREGHVFYPPEYFIEGFPRDIILDGELYMGRGNFQTCVGTVKRHVPTEAWKKIQFVVFDAPSVSACFADRLLEAAKKFKLTDIARVTADDVFRCVETIDRLAKIHIDNSSLATLSKGLPYGCNTEVINVKYL